MTDPRRNRAVLAVSVALYCAVTIGAAWVVLALLQWAHR